MVYENSVVATDTNLIEHPTEAILELALACAARAEFERESLTLLGSIIQHTHAFIISDLGEDSPSRAPSPRLAAKGYSAAQCALLRERSAVFGAELVAVKSAAEVRGGVAVDTSVLGPRALEAQYYRELVAPLGGGHSMLCVLGVRGQPQGLLVIGRSGSAFREPELETVRRLRPALALSLATFADSSSNEPLEPSRGALTRREREIASYLRLGYTNREIAGALGTSAHTVRNQLARLFSKVGVSTRAELVGLLSSSS